MMELDELKNTWLELDDRLKKNENLNERIIKEMLQNKSNKSLSKLINFDIFMTILSVLAFPFVLFMFDNRIKHTTMTDLSFYIGLGMASIGMFPQMYKVILLMKIDLTKKLSDNIKYIQKYSILIKREKLFYSIVVPFFLVIVFLGFNSLAQGHHLEPWRWAFPITVFILAFFISYWQYKKIYETNIQSIKKSLEELKELEEE